VYAYYCWTYDIAVRALEEDDGGRVHSGWDVTSRTLVLAPASPPTKSEQHPRVEKSLAFRVMKPL